MCLKKLLRAGSALTAILVGGVVIFILTVPQGLEVTITNKGSSPIRPGLIRYESSGTLGHSHQAEVPRIQPGSTHRFSFQPHERGRDQAHDEGQVMYLVPGKDGKPEEITLCGYVEGLPYGSVEVTVDESGKAVVIDTCGP